MLITSKASESKLVINKEQVDIIELTQQAQEQIDTNYASKPHAIGIHDHREENALVYADKYLIENVMHNLIVWRGAHCSEESLNNVMYNLRRYFAKDASPTWRHCAVKDSRCGWMNSLMHISNSSPHKGKIVLIGDILRKYSCFNREVSEKNSIFAAAETWKSGKKRPKKGWKSSISSLK